MGATYELSATVREKVGKGAARSVRRQGMTPAVIYGGNQPPMAISLAARELSLKILGGDKPSSQTVLVNPEAWDNTTDEGKAKLKAAADPSLSPEWPVSIMIPDWTTYTKEQIVACKGPGE